MLNRLFALCLLPLAVAMVRADAPGALPSDEAAVTHALNRLTFGPRPGDVSRVQAMGLERWIEQQLSPSNGSSAALDARLARLTTLTIDPATLAREYHIPAQMERRQVRETGAGSREPGAESQEPGAQAPSPRSQDPVIRKDQQIITDFSEAKILRAVYSDRQLEEVLVDFWFNHFNVFAGKGPERVWVSAYEREAIRPYVFGNFRNMLEAVAKSEAMLFYLDNWQSGVEKGSEGFRRVPRGSERFARGRALSGAGPQDTRSRRGPFAQRPKGINENYARELMELHTLGVDGGYTQQDVTEVARAFTGWTMTAPGGAGFRFDSSIHDNGEKRVLGHVIKAGGGMNDGEQVLDILASHPSTAQFIARKLAVRFISDEPPQSIVDRAAARFTATKGDLREVVRAIITAPEFFAPEARSAKVKTPFEFVVSALRATNANVVTARPLVRQLRDFGMPLYFCQPPTGYDDTAVTWVSTGALVSRINFAIELGNNRVRGTRISGAGDELAARLGSPEFQKR